MSSFWTTTTTTSLADIRCTLIGKTSAKFKVQYLQEYCLFQYREVCRDRNAEVTSPFQSNNLSVKLSKQVLVVKYFFFFFLLRCFSLAFISSTRDSPIKRVSLGTEVWKSEGGIFEVLFIFECVIGYLFLQFSFTTNLLHYKFLAVFHMQENGSHFSYTLFGLTRAQFARFSRLRRQVLLVNNLVVGFFTTFGFAAVCWLYINAGLFISHPLWSGLWLLILEYFIFATFITIFANLMAFQLLMVYITEKQAVIGRQMKQCTSAAVQRAYHQQTFSTFSYPIAWYRLQETAVLYAYLFDELADYSLFWSPLISFFFLFCSLMIAYILYVSLFSTLSIFINGLLILYMTSLVLIFSGITLYCGKIVRTNELLARWQLAACAQLTKARTFDSSSFTERRYRSPMPTASLIKFHLLAALLLANSQSGFILLNGYLITHDTMRLLATNIAVYFILFISRFH